MAKTPTSATVRGQTDNGQFSAHVLIQHRIMIITLHLYDLPVVHFIIITAKQAIYEGVVVYVLSELLYLSSNILHCSQGKLSTTSPPEAYPCSCIS